MSYFCVICGNMNGSDVTVWVSEWASSYKSYLQQLECCCDLAWHKLVVGYCRFSVWIIVYMTDLCIFGSWKWTLRCWWQMELCEIMVRWTDHERIDYKAASTIVIIVMFLCVCCVDRMLIKCLYGWFSELHFTSSSSAFWLRLLADWLLADWFSTSVGLLPIFWYYYMYTVSQ